MTCGNDAAIPQTKFRIDWVHGIGLRYGIDFVHPHQFGIASQSDLVATADNIQVAYLYMIAELQVCDPYNNV